MPQSIDFHELAKEYITYNATDVSMMGLSEFFEFDKLSDEDLEILYNLISDAKIEVSWW